MIASPVAAEGSWSKLDCVQDVTEYGSHSASKAQTGTRRVSAQESLSLQPTGSLSGTGLSQPKQLRLEINGDEWGGKVGRVSIDERFQYQ
eukprot:jgi/Ulvmu1/10371/UM061_0054.1